MQASYHLRLFLVVGCTFVLCTSHVQSAPPLSRLIRFKRVEANPQSSYRLSEERGPWLILASTFSGPGSEQQAHELVLELRDKFKLHAYLHKKRFDYSDPVVGLGWNRYGGPKKMHHRQKVAFDEWAVMVGDFPSIDDPVLERTLKQLKYARPSCLDLGPGEASTQRFAGIRARLRQMSKDPEKRKKGPMGHAFVTRNPLLPVEHFAPQGMDKFVKKLNQGLDYSLLDCSGKYTVRVATFRGNVVLDQRKVKEILNGAKMASRLEEAAAKAHKLTEALRKEGVEAYEFHDRNESCVTVGSFNSLGSQRSDGQIDTHPAIRRIIENYGASSRQVPGVAAPVIEPRLLDGIPFDVRPVPILVPRYSLGNDYVSDASSEW